MSQFSKEDITSIDTIRTLAADVVFKSNSGHPGAPMGLAAAAHVLFTRYASATSSTFSLINLILSIGS
jgi:transketolase